MNDNDARRRENEITDISLASAGYEAIVTFYITVYTKQLETLILVEISEMIKKKIMTYKESYHTGKKQMSVH